MKAFVTIVAFVLVAPVLHAGTLTLNGVLTPVEPIGGRGPGDGSFSLRLSGDTLDYTVNTRRIGDTFAVPDADLTLDLPSSELTLDFTSHGAVTASGCYPFFIWSALSWRYDGEGFVAAPLEVAPPTTDCDMITAVSILAGSIQLGPAQMQDFQTPGFDVSFASRSELPFGGPFELFGRTDPNVVLVPEPTSMALLTLGSLMVWAGRHSSKRRTRRCTE